MTEDIAVCFEQVSFCVDRRELISDLNFAIEAGESLVLLGRSGSGKTTTLKLINTLIKPSAGKITVQGRSTNDWSPIKLRRSIGYVIQSIGLFPHFTVAENIALVPTLLQWQPDRVEARVKELLALVGLEPKDFRDRYPHQLSGGQRQRIGVARALAADPPILLMDEPFGALDPITRLELQQQLSQWRQQLGKTLVFVTHDIQEAFVLGTRIGLMENGKLVTLGSPSEFKRCEHPEAQKFLACLNI
ncbi:MAG: ATP-binding cassette domain-containing protein [Synechococcaceae cyanobacterium RL_1_2]|nr:ATP-binding cassette domain-containing protein [Synechococcaceae cyanobacterium RL_1_2]